MSKIVITGMNAISSCGIGYDALKENIAKGVTPVKESEYEYHKLPREVETFRVTGFEPKEILGRKGLRTLDNAAKFLLSTIHLKWGEELAEMSDEEKPGLVMGTAFGSMESIGNFQTVADQTGVGSVNPKLFGNCVLNAPTGQANIRFGLKNLSTTMVTGFNSGLAALVYSADFINSGYLPNLLCGAVEESSVYTLMAMEKEGCLSKSNKIKPFSKDADGQLLGEGCAVVALESEEYAKSKGSEIIAELAGFAVGFDPNGGELGFNDDAEVATDIINLALKDAGIEAKDIAFVVSDANGLPAGDRMRAKAIANVFGSDTPVTSYRSTLGETYGAAGMLDVVAAIADLDEKRVSPIFGDIETIDGIDAVINAPREINGEYALITSFTVDGNCTAVVIKKN